MIKFNENATLKPYIDNNTDLRKKKQKLFLKEFLKLMNNAVFGRTKENARNIEIKTCHNGKKRKLFGFWNKLSYCKIIHRKFIHKKMKTEREALMNKPVYLGLSMQD